VRVDAGRSALGSVVAVRAVAEIRPSGRIGGEARPGGAGLGVAGLGRARQGEVGAEGSGMSFAEGLILGLALGAAAGWCAAMLVSRGL
jgi:hypothetical protein